jgi:hypothetical protein
MGTGNPGMGPHTSQPKRGKRVPICWCVAWIAALTVGGLTASLVVAESNPDWPAWTGTQLYRLLKCQRARVV